MNWKTWTIVAVLLAGAMLLAWSTRSVGEVDSRVQRGVTRVHQMCVDVLEDLRMQDVAPEILEPEFVTYCPELLKRP